MSYQSVFQRDLFRGQVAIVTGGGTGIGRCIAHELAFLGAEVVLASRKIENLEQVRAEICKEGGKAHAIACNIRSEDEVRHLIEQTLTLTGRLDFLVNNGGGQFVTPIAQLSLKGWNAVIDTNLTGTFLMCREAFSQYFGEHGGAIVNIVADMWRGMPMMGHSGAARAGVVNLTQTCALEWAGSGVRVNAVAPGLIRSSGFLSYPEPVQELLGSLANEIPMARYGTESEVSGAVVFLLSPAARYITGATLRVDGAHSLYRQAFSLPERPPSKRYAGFDLGPEASEADDAAE